MNSIHAYSANCFCITCAQVRTFSNQQQTSLNQWHVEARYPAMTASDLGIVDQLLDDKVGMEP